jgi:ATPase subunit of ABC transporter with duplicated ATPase domains
MSPFAPARSLHRPRHSSAVDRGSAVTTRGVIRHHQSEAVSISRCLTAALLVGTTLAGYGVAIGTADAQDKKYRFVMVSHMGANDSNSKWFYLSLAKFEEKFPDVETGYLSTSEYSIRAFGLRSNVSAEDEVAMFSGGARQSVKIGRAVEFKNRVIIMDEPTNHLSAREREHVNEITPQLREQGLLVIYITHDIFQVHRIADRVVIMENGEKVADLRKHEMTAEELEHIIRDGGREIGTAAA